MSLNWGSRVGWLCLKNLCLKKPNVGDMIAVCCCNSSVAAPPAGAGRNRIVFGGDMLRYPLQHTARFAYLALKPSLKLGAHPRPLGYCQPEEPVANTWKSSGLELWATFNQFMGYFWGRVAWDFELLGSSGQAQGPRAHGVSSMVATLSPKLVVLGH